MFKIIFSYILVFLGWTVMYIEIRSPVWKKQISSQFEKVQADLRSLNWRRSPQEEEER